MSNAKQQALEAGTRAEGAGNLEEALKHYTRAVQLAPTDPQVLTLRAAALSNLGRNEEALADFNALLAQDPKHAPGLWGRGTVLRRVGRLPEARADLVAAIGLQPIPIYYLELANIHITAGDHQDALNALEKTYNLALDEARENHSIGSLQYAVMAMKTTAQIYRAHGQEEQAAGAEKQAAQLAQALSKGEGGSEKGGCGGKAATAAVLMLLPFLF